MESVIVGLVVLAFVGYGLYKVFVKQETVAEAATEIKNEVVAEAKKVEEVAAPVVTAEVAKVEEVAKTEETKVEEVAKKTATRAKKTATKAAAVAKAVEKKVANKATRNKKTST